MRRAVVVSGIVGLLGVTILAGASPASAGLFEFLFGAQQPAPAYAPAPSYAPSTIVVRPKRSHRGSRTREARRPRMEKAETGRRIAYVRIDTEREPDWYLRDATLRRGDVIVLKTGPVVFEGPGEARHTIEEFASLNDSRYVSAGGKRAIRMMVSGIWSAADPSVTEAAPRRSRRAARHRWSRTREAAAQ